MTVRLNETDLLGSIVIEDDFVELTYPVGKIRFSPFNIYIQHSGLDYEIVREFDCSNLLKFSAFLRYVVLNPCEDKVYCRIGGFVLKFENKKVKIVCFEGEKPLFSFLLFQLNDLKKKERKVYSLIPRSFILMSLPSYLCRGKFRIIPGISVSEKELVFNTSFYEGVVRLSYLKRHRLREFTSSLRTGEKTFKLGDGILIEKASDKFFFSREGRVFAWGDEVDFHAFHLALLGGKR